MRTRLAGIIEWIGERELGALAALLIAVGAVWAFVELADEVVEGETAAIDETLLLAFRTAGDVGDPLGPPWAEELARDVTGLGGAGILAFVTAASAGFLYLAGKRHLALYVVAAVASGALATTLLKLGFDRPRPDIVTHGQAVYTASFPSGHAMLSAVTYLTLGALLAGAQQALRLKVYVLGLGVLITGAVGVSRIYLGVHWPTDVLAGWTAGAAWALACGIVARALRRAGAVE